MKPVLPSISVKADLRGAQVKAAIAAGRSQNRQAPQRIRGMKPVLPSISVKADLRRAQVKAAIAAGRSQNRRLLRGFAE